MRGMMISKRGDFEKVCFRSVYDSHIKQVYLNQMDCNRSRRLIPTNPRRQLPARSLTLDAQHITPHLASFPQPAHLLLHTNKLHRGRDGKQPNLDLLQAGQAGSDEERVESRKGIDGHLFRTDVEFEADRVQGRVCGGGEVGEEGQRPGHGCFGVFEGEPEGEEGRVVGEVEVVD